MFFVNCERVSELAAHYRLPAMYPFSAPVLDAGGLMAYEVDNVDLQTRAAVYVDKILKGAKPSDLPVQQPTEFKLFINLKAAKGPSMNNPVNSVSDVTAFVELARSCSSSRRGRSGRKD
jgi:putative ABC transport system substrate-binding protein